MGWICGLMLLQVVSFSIHFNSLSIHTSYCYARTLVSYIDLLTLPIFPHTPTISSVSLQYRESQSPTHRIASFKAIAPFSHQAAMFGFDSFGVIPPPSSY